MFFPGPHWWAGLDARPTTEDRQSISSTTVGDRRLQRYTGPDVLILDDLGLRPLRHEEPLDLYDLIRGRYERGATIINSDRAIDEWYELWSDQEGVFSHETALACHELSHTLPATAEMTVPRAWRKRRLRVPDSLELHFDDIAAPDRTWHGPIPITTPARTLRDCALAGVSHELVYQALAAGRQRGVLTDEDDAQTCRPLERRS